MNLQESSQIKQRPCKRSLSTSAIHFQVQTTIQNILLPNQTILECRFPEINRIADLVWPEKKIIFEVQVSPISSEEILARNRDYARIGYRVIWILHDNQFNRFHLTPAEIAIRTSPHYFTNMDAFGKVFFYDQTALIRNKKRVKRSFRAPIDFSIALPLNLKQLKSQISKERKNWPLYFRGDLIDRQFSWPKPKRSLLRLLLHFSSILKIFYRLLLEKTCS